MWRTQDTIALLSNVVFQMNLDILEDGMGKTRDQSARKWISQPSKNLAFLFISSVKTY